METPVNPDNRLLKNKYDLHNKPEIEVAARRTLAHTGEKVPQDPLARIGNYLNRFHEITDRTDPEDREHGIDATKRLLYRKYVIRPDEIPGSYWENQKRIVRERGQGADLEQIDWEQQKQPIAEALIADQRASLDKWVDYLSSSDAPYSDGLKYYTLRSVLNMGSYDKDKKAFTERSKGTVKPFPDLNREALAYVLDAISKKYNKGYDIDLASFEETDAEEFEKLLQSENFSRLYAWAVDKVTPATAEDLAVSSGEWIKYDQNSDHIPLVRSLEGHGTGWCTAGESTAQAQLEAGDFYVYYSMNRSGKPTVPRIAIRMEENRIAEVRGIGPDQNLDAGVSQIVEDKLKEFPDGELYKKRVADMKLMTEIENKTKTRSPLSAEELRFLYEIDSLIEGFGYERDPRIREILDIRIPEQDILTVFNCEQSEIANEANQINEETKVYVGPLTPGIFDKILKYNLEYVYTKFPEDRIVFRDLEVGGKSPQELKRQLREEGIDFGASANDLLESSSFTTSSESQHLTTVELRASDLNITEKITTESIYAKAKELGLELCPAETGPDLSLKYKDKLLSQYGLLIGMEQIADPEGNGRIFWLGRKYGSDLSAIWADPQLVWTPDDRFVFALPK
jgi:hypothetical protein